MLGLAQAALQIGTLPPVPFAGVAYKSTQTTTVDENTTTWTDVDIGEPHPKRIVILGISKSNTTQLFSVLVNGISAQHIVTQNEWTIYVAQVSHGALATLRVQYLAGTPTRKAVSIWVAYPNNHIPLDFGGATANTSTPATIANLKVQAGGFLVYAGGQNAISGSFTTTWGGVDAVVEDADAQIETGTYTSGHINATRSSDIDDLVMTQAVSGTKRIVAATWGPPPPSIRG